MSAILEKIKSVFKDMVTFPRLGVGLVRVWQRDFLVYKKFLLTSMFWNFMEPLLYMIAFGYGLGFFVGEIDGISYKLFFAPAVLATAAFQGAVFESTYSSFTKMKIQKSYDVIMMTPVSLQNIIAGEIFWAASKAFFSALAVLIVFFFMGLIQYWVVLFSLPVLFVLAWVMAAMGMVMTTYAGNYDAFTYFFSVLITPMTLLAGTYFPLTHFPKWAQVVAQTMPLTHGVHIIRELFLGHSSPMLLINLGVLLIMAVLLTNWAIANAHRRLIN